MLVAVGLAFPARAAAQNCSPSYKEVAQAMYNQVLELGAVGGAVDQWASYLQGGTTVKQMVYENVHWQGYRDRFITGHDGRTVLTYLYRHLLAREPDDNAWGWVAIGQRDGWHVVINGLMNSDEYNTRFGDHVLPGSPVTAWDCQRATGVFEAHQNSFRDATQGTATLGYSTPAYVSLDQPRALGFVFSTGLLNATGLVQVNMVDNSGTPPDQASIRLQLDGAWLTEEIFFRAGPGATRLAASFNAGGYQSGAYGVRAVVRKYWPGRTEEYALNTRAIVVNEKHNPVGRGWAIAGQQWLRDQGDGVLITESGTGTWFAKLGNDPDGSRRYASPPGDFSRVRWDAGEGAYVRDYPDGTRVRFSLGGRMTQVTTRTGDITMFHYTPSGALERVVDPLGFATLLSYSPQGALTAVQDPGGRRVSTATDYNTLFRFVEPDGTLALDLDFVYDPTYGSVLGNYWTAGGNRGAGVHTGWTIAYDAHGKLASLTAPQVNTTDAGATRPVTRFRSLESAVLPAAGAGTAANPALRQQPHAVRVEATDPRGNTTRLALDPFGAPTRVEEPLGRVTSIFRDRHGRVMRTDAHSGHVVLNEYVGVQLRKVTDATTGAVVSAEYEPVFNQPTHIWGTGIAAVWNTYDTADPQRKLLTTRSGTATSPVTSYTYTTRGRVSSVTDPEGHGTFFQYGDRVLGGNPWGNREKVSTGTASSNYRRTSVLRFDGYGRTIASISPGSDTTHTVYDLNNRVTRTIGAARDTTSYEYQPTGLHRVTDAKGQMYVYNRNVLGWVESEIDPRAYYTSYGYDRGGNVTSMTNRRGQTITWGYDALGRITVRNADNQQTTWSYDPGDRWMQVVNAEGTNRTEYDVAGRATHIRTTLGGVTYTQAVEYDSEARPTQLSVTGPWNGAKTIGYTYNARGQLDTLRDLGGFTSTLAYNGDGLPAGRSLPGGIATDQSYVSTHAPSRLGFNSYPTTIALGTQYSYDANGLVQARQWYQQDESGTAEIFRHYAYDRQGQLKRYDDEKIPEGSNTCSGTTLIDPDGGVCVPEGQGQIVGGASYVYDKVGNRTDRGGTAATGNRQMTFDGYQFTYDDDGNLLRKWKTGYDRTLGWNSLSQMISATPAGQGTTTYGYDGFGRRVRMTAPNGSVTRYLYDGDDLLMELDGAGNPIREYTYLPGVDKPHSVRVSATGASYYYATDHPGNVVGLLNAAGQVVSDYEYDPWGVATVIAHGVQQPLGYAAREWDAAAGLYQVRARWYDPYTGRFVSEDPIGLQGGINLYRYAANNPINATDPYGLEPVCTAWFIVTVNVETGEVIAERHIGTTCPGGGTPQGTNRKCTVPPLLPRGQSVNANISVAEPFRLTPLVKNQWFAGMVGKRGPWDYQQWEGKPHPEYENGGNFNYGATGAAAWFSRGYLQRMAGLAQYLFSDPQSVHGRPWDGPPYGDEPADQTWIALGFDYYTQGCHEQTAPQQ